MKKILKLLVLMVFLINCENRLCGCSPVPRILEGKWKLYQIDFGYPPPNQPTFTKDVEDIVMEFDESNSTFNIYKKNKVTESGKFLFTEDDKGKRIEFLTNDTYSTMTFSTDYQEIYLYERSIKGAVLADGNTYRYRKII